jgi:putative tricarboxylic transport membrane protein
VKIDDALWGAVLMLFSAVLLVHVQGFPTIPGQRVGPSALPSALAVGLFVCGALLAWKGWRARAAAGACAPPWVERPEWFGARPQVIGFAVLVGVNVGYLLLVERLGFIVTGVAYLAALMAVLRVPALRALLLWGMLQGVAW